MFNLSSRVALSLVSGLFVLVIYQNCSNDEFRSSSSLNSFNANVAQLDVGETHPSIFKSSSKAEVQALFANRVLVKNIMVSIFGPSLNADFTEQVGWAASEFGSGWGIYDKRITAAATCKTTKNSYYLCANLANNSSVTSIVGASAPREGIRITICNKAIDNNTSLGFSFDKIEKGALITKPPAVSDDNLKRVFQLFYRGKPLPEESYFDSLKIVMDNASDVKEGWKSILLSLCLSPHWQVL